MRKKKYYHLHTKVLNFTLKGKILFKISQGLNVTLYDYEAPYILLRVLMDFMENYAIGDIYLMTPLLDIIVDRYGP